MKVARTVLRGPRRSNAPGLPDREVRMVKVSQKVSGCLRTMTGAKQFTTIRSYLATVTKHGIGLFQALTELPNGNPWLPETA